MITGDADTVGRLVEGVGISTLSWRIWKGLRLLGWGGNGEAVSAVEGISVDALAGGCGNTVD